MRGKFSTEADHLQGWDDTIPLRTDLFAEEIRTSKQFAISKPRVKSFDRMVRRRKELENQTPLNLGRADFNMFEEKRVLSLKDQNRKFFREDRPRLSMLKSPKIVVESLNSFMRENNQNIKRIIFRANSGFRNSEVSLKVKLLEHERQRRREENRARLELPPAAEGRQASLFDLIKVRHL